MDMGIFGQQHHPEGIPVQSGQRVEGGILAGFSVVAQDQIGQSAGKPAPGGVDQHPGRFIHCQQVFVFVKNRQGAVLCRIIRLGFLQRNRDDIPGLYGIIGMLGDAVDKELILPFQPVHEPCGHGHFFSQKRREPPLPLGNVFEFHGFTSLGKIKMPCQLWQGII